MSNDQKIKFERIKNVFKLLIDEAKYLVDDRTRERCLNATPKEQFSLKIDSIRKSLGVEHMEDVELLIDIFYSFEEEHQKEEEEAYQRTL